MAAPFSLHQVARIFYCVYYLKWATQVFYPAVAQEYFDFCPGCDFGSETGNVTAQYEAWTNFFIALSLTAVAQFTHDGDIRTALCWYKAIPGFRLIVLARVGKETMTDGNVFYNSVMVNIFLFIFSLLTTHVWHKRTAKDTKYGKFGLYDYRTGTFAMCLEYVGLAGLAGHQHFTGEANTIRPNDAGVFGATAVFATYAGIALMYWGISQAESDQSQKTFVQYSMLHKIINLFYLSVIAAPFTFQANGEQGLNVLYGRAFFYTLTLVHLMSCAYYAPVRRMVFWMAAIVAVFLGVLGLIYPASTASTYYRMEELSGASDSVYKLVGMGACIVGAALLAFSQEFNMDVFEVKFVYTYGFVLLHSYFTEGTLPAFGVFSDLLNAFLFWCIWFNYSNIFLSVASPWCPSFLRRTVIKVAAVASPPVSPKKSVSAKKNGRGRSKTPARKSK